MSTRQDHALTGQPTLSGKADGADDETLDSGLITEDSEIAQAAHCLKAMSHPLRLKILCVLGGEAVSVQDIVEQVGTTQSNISQHLAILRDKGILAYRKDANRVYYYIDDRRMLQLIGMMKEVFCPH